MVLQFGPEPREGSHAISARWGVSYRRLQCRRCCYGVQQQRQCQAGCVSQQVIRGPVLGRPVVRGLFIGLWLSVAQAASLRQNMSGTPLRLDSGDPLLYGGAALLLALAAVLAMTGPARRGSKSDPLEALRCD